MNILITGKNGFIGSYLCQNLREYSPVGWSLRYEGVEQLNSQNSTIVIHTSGIAHQKKSATNELYQNINVEQTLDLARHVKKNGCRHFIFLSSVKVYGDGVSVFTENSDYLPSDYYGKSKLDAEKKLLELEDDNFRVTILRLPLVYGPNPKGNIKLLLKLVQFPLIPLGKIENRRSILSLSNLTEYLTQIIDARIYGVLIPSDRQPVSTTEMMSYMVEAQKAKSKIFRMPLVLRSLLKVCNPGIYMRLFSDFYAENDETLSKFNLDKINETEKEFCTFFGKVKE